jgi:hypothetical protein
VTTPLYADYAAWLDGLRNWLGTDEQPDLDTSTFLYLAQLRLNRELQSVPMERSVDIPITAPLAGLPLDLATLIPDFNKIRLVLPYTNGRPLYSSSINEMTEMIALAAQTSDTPNPEDPGFFCIDTGQLYLFPAPIENNTVVVKYYPYVEPLSVTVAANTFSNYHSDLLLFAALIEGSQFVVEDERIAVWKQSYAEGVESSNNTGKHQKLGSTPLVRQIKGLS